LGFLQLFSRRCELNWSHVNLPHLVLLNKNNKFEIALHTTR
jgi:hypothetical protein